MTNLGNKEVMAKNLAYYMDKSGKSQKEVADVLGISTSTFNDWIKAKKYPRIDKIEMLAAYFHVLKSDLIEDKSEEFRETQKNNSTIAQAVARMRKDTEFLSIVEELNSLTPDQLNAIKAVLSAIGK